MHTKYIQYIVTKSLLSPKKVYSTKKNIYIFYIHSSDNILFFSSSIKFFFPVETKEYNMRIWLKLFTPLQFFFFF